MRDAVLREIIQNGLDTLAQEVGAFAARSAYSPFVNETPEIAAAIFDRDGRLVAQAKRSLMHLSAVRIALRELIKDWPLEKMNDGDAFVFNDHFRGGIHPTDVMVFKPIFYNGELAFFYGSMMIVSDLGGLSAAGLPANATECFHEGLIIPAVRLYLSGELNEDVARLIQANSRTPQRVMGDIRALVAGGNMAAARLAELVEKYGTEDLMAIIEELMSYSERLTRQGIEEIPDGTYQGSYVVEEDGVVPEKTYTVKVRITIDGSKCRVDLSGSDPQARGAINSSYSQSLSGIVFALLCYLGAEIPMNEGFYRPIEVEIPLGTIVNPKYPAACNIRIGAVMAIIDSITQAFSAIYPDKILAPGATPHVAIAAGRYPGRDEMWSLLDPLFGPGGARSVKDAVDAMAHPLFEQSAYGRNIENYEIEYPIRYERFGLWTDSGGPGEWRGGCAIQKEIRLLVDANLTVRIVDRAILPPLGLAGGGAGRGGGWIIDRGEPTQWSPPPKQTNIFVQAGSTLTMLVSGGGGYGDPFKRDPQLVARDIEDGFVSVEGAARDYGVSIDPDTGKVDAAATNSLRRGNG